MSGQVGVTAAVDEPQHVVMSDFFHEADAAGTKDAALVIEGHSRTEFDVLGFLDFVLREIASLRFRTGR